jgi:hypothetical protein
VLGLGRIALLNMAELELQLLDPDLTQLNESVILLPILEFLGRALFD